MADEVKQYWAVLAVNLAIITTVMMFFGYGRINIDAIARVLGATLSASIFPLLAMRFFSNRAGWCVLAVLTVGYLYSALDADSPSQAPASSNMSYVAITTIACEFSVRFPGQPNVEIYSHPELGAYEEAIWMRQAGRYSVFLRTECANPSGLSEFVNKIGAEEFLLNQLRIFANNNGLSSVSYQYAETEAGPSGTARGIKHIQGVPTTFMIKVVTGNRSLITMYAGGESSTFPQPEVFPFLSSVGLNVRDITP